MRNDCNHFCEVRSNFKRRSGAEHTYWLSVLSGFLLTAHCCQCFNCKHFDCRNSKGCISWSASPWIHWMASTLNSMANPSAAMCCQEKSRQHRKPICALCTGSAFEIAAHFTKMVTIIPQSWTPERLSAIMDSR